MNNVITLSISLLSEEQALPYSGSESGHHYESLLENPKAVSDFPELKGELTMTNFVLGIHSPSGTFESARIDHCFCEEPSGSVVRRLAIGLLFRDRRLFQQYSNCMMFAGNLLLAAQNGTVESDEALLLEIQPLILRQTGNRGWIMDVYFSGRGTTEDAAKNRLDQLLHYSAPFFQTGGASSQPIQRDS